MDDANTANTKKKTDEIKQAFLSSAISDISAYIQLADTKVSIIMAAEKILQKLKIGSFLNVSAQVRCPQ